MQSGNRSSVFKIALISAATTLAILLFVAAIGGAAYYFVIREAPPNTAEKPELLSDKLKRAERTLGLSSTDPAKVSAITYSSWSHVGPLYPGPTDSPGYVDRREIQFRRDLSATLIKEKNYDRDGPDELSNSTARLTEQQFQRLAEVCAKFDIANEPDVTDNISERGTHLTIEYNGETKRIVTSNTGKNSPGIAELLKAIDDLQRGVAWTPAGKR